MSVDYIYCSNLLWNNYLITQKLPDQLPHHWLLMCQKCFSWEKHDGNLMSLFILQLLSLLLFSSIFFNTHPLPAIIHTSNDLTFPFFHLVSGWTCSIFNTGGGGHFLKVDRTICIVTCRYTVCTWILEKCTWILLSDGLAKMTRDGDHQLDISFMYTLQEYNIMLGKSAHWIWLGDHIVISPILSYCWWYYLHCPAGNIFLLKEEECNKGTRMLPFSSLFFLVLWCNPCTNKDMHNWCLV